MEKQQKFGLNLPQKPSKSNVKSIRPAISVFSAENETREIEEFSEGGHRKLVGQELTRQGDAGSHKRKFEETSATVLDNDPNAFDYDEVYDKMQMEKQRISGYDLNSKDRKPKYVEAIMQKALERKQHLDIVFERKLQKEAKKDETLYENSEKFVTSAYKQKLLERQKIEEQEKIRENEEDVTKKGDMLGFYRNLLTKNVAYGAPNTHKKTNSK